MLINNEGDAIFGMREVLALTPFYISIQQGIRTKSFIVNQYQDWIWISYGQLDLDLEWGKAKVGQNEESYMF